MKNNEWLINKDANTITHITHGIIFTIEQGELTNIENIPPTVTSKQLPLLIKEATLQYKHQKARTPKLNMPPKRATLSLKKS